MKWLKVLVPVIVLALAGAGVWYLSRPPAQIILYAPPEKAAEIKIDDHPVRIEAGQSQTIPGPAKHKIELVGAPAIELSGAGGWGVPTRREQCFELTEGGSVRGFMFSHPFRLPARALREGRFRAAPCRDLKYETTL